MNEATRRSSARPAFKVGDDVIERAKPFKLYAIKDLLPPDSGEHTYQITDQGLDQEKLRVVGEQARTSILSPSLIACTTWVILPALRRMCANH
jgi:hypothetical protein